jgi:hypothetical protein
MVDSETVSAYILLRFYITDLLPSGMADRGNGIRIFNSVDSLKDIFEEFENASDVSDDGNIDTSVITSQLRHFVVQASLRLEPPEKKSMVICRNI